MLTTALQTLIGTALIDREFSGELLSGTHSPLSKEFPLAREAAKAIETGSIHQFTTRWHNQDVSDGEAFLVECLAWGLLQTHGVEESPVPVREMILNPLPIFENLTLLEVSLGLYKATYRSCLDGSRLIIVDGTTPDQVQRESVARELYVAFCHSSRASELNWFKREQPRVHSDLFARCLLMPAPWIRKACAEDIPTEGLAARFGVPIHIARERLGEVIHHRPPSGLGEPLAEMMFSLEEPWRGRFLELVVSMAASKTTTTQRGRPTQREVANWLDTNPSLYQDIRYLLNSWRRSWNIGLTAGLVQGSAG